MSILLVALEVLLEGFCKWREALSLTLQALFQQSERINSPCIRNNDVAMYIDGVQVATDSSLTIPAVANYI
jgi:hypothetical protein